MKSTLSSTVAHITSMGLANSLSSVARDVDVACAALNAGSMEDAVGMAPGIEDLQKLAAIEQGEQSPRYSGAARNGHWRGGKRSVVSFEK